MTFGLVLKMASGFIGRPAARTDAGLTSEGVSSAAKSSCLVKSNQRAHRNAATMSKRNRALQKNACHAESNSLLSIAASTNASIVRKHVQRLAHFLAEKLPRQMFRSTNSRTVIIHGSQGTLEANGGIKHWAQRSAHASGHSFANANAVAGCSLVTLEPVITGRGAEVITADFNVQTNLLRQKFAGLGEGQNVKIGAAAGTRPRTDTSGYGSKNTHHSRARTIEPFPSIAWLWKKLLAVTFSHAKRFTTRTASATITAQRILNSGQRPILLASVSKINHIARPALASSTARLAVHHG